MNVKEEVDYLISIKGDCSNSKNYIRCENCILRKICYHFGNEIPKDSLAAAEYVKSRGYDLQSIMFEILL